MRIINRSLLRELTTNTLAVAFIFVALFMVVSLVKILAKAAAGSFPAKLIFTMLGLQTVEILSLMLPLAFYIGLLITLGRWYQDNEMTVLAACGSGSSQPEESPSAWDKTKPEKLSIYNWSDYMSPQVLKDFEAAYGIPVVESFYGGNEELLAKMKAGVTGNQALASALFRVS